MAVSIIRIVDLEFTTVTVVLLLEDDTHNKNNVFLQFP